MTVPVDARDASPAHATPIDDAPGTAAANASSDETPVRAEGTNLPGRPLTDDRAAYLAGEGIGSYVQHLVAAGLVRSAEPGDPVPDNFNLREERQRGIWFAYPKADGSIRWQIKPDVQDDGEPKYVSAKGGPLGYALRRRGTSDLVIIAEGTKQSLAAAAAVEGAATGFARDAVEVANSTVIGIPGVTGWSEGGALPFDFHRLCQGKRVVIMTDKDAATNIDVYQGAERLGQALTLATSVAYAPNPGGGKDGLDDVLKQVEEAERPGLLAAIVAGASNKPATKKPPAKTIVTDDMLPTSGASLVITSADAYDRIARELIDRCFLHAEERVPTLAFNGGLWWTHAGSRWVAVEDHIIPGTVWTLLASAVVVDNADDEFGRPYPISKYRRDNVLEGLRARLATDPPKTQTAASYWITWHNGKWRHTADPTGPVIACANGLLTRNPDPRNGQRAFYAHTPRYWNLTSLAVAYDANATESEALDQLLTGAWPDDPECCQLALEILGYIASGDVSLQKIFFFWGPKRAGKGKLLDVLTALVGEAQVEASGLSEMSRPFGIENWIEKGLAILDDARDEHVDVGLLSRRMLSISGAAMTAVERKGIKNWSGRLATRIVITSNLLIELRDPAGVLASRMEVLPFSKSFYGEEDLTLGARLENQMSAILNLGLAAYDRLVGEQGGRFTRPESAARDHEMLAAGQSPEEAFLTECCELGPKERDSKFEVYRTYTRWCEDSGRKARAEASFFRIVYSVTGRAVYPVKAAPSEGRQPMVQGLRVRRVTDALNAALQNGSLVPGQAEPDPGQPSVPSQLPAAGVRDGVRDVSGVGDLPGQAETAGQVACLSGVSGVSGQIDAHGKNSDNVPKPPVSAFCFIDKDPGHPGHPGQADPDRPDPEVGGLIAHTSDVFGRPTYSPWLDVDPSELLRDLTGDASTVALHVHPADPDAHRLATVSIATGTARVALMDSEAHMSALRAWLTSTSATLTVHGGPDQLGRLADAGLGKLDALWARTVDTRILDHLLRPGDGTAELDHTLDGAMRFWFPTVGFLPTPEAFDVAQLAAALLPQVDEHLGAEVRQREHHLAATIHQSAHRGLAVAHERAKQHLRIAGQTRSKKLNALKQVGVTDPNNPKQLQAAFAAVGVAVDSTKGAALKSLVLDGDAEVLRRAVLEYREAAATEYAMRPLVNASAGADGVHRVHPVIDTLGARTGRFTTAEPAVTNLAPVHREFLQAEAGHVLVAADYSAIEVRVAAALSGDTALIGRLAAGEDPHTAAAELAGVTREQAKPVLLGWLYGSGIARTAEQLGVTVAEAEVIRDRMAAAMPRLVEWIEGEVARVRSGADRGVSATPLGRRVQVHASRAATVAVNTVVQSAARDVLVRAIERLDDMGWGKYLWLTVHDEIVLHVPEGAAAQAVGLLEQAMADSIGGVQLTAKASVLGARWGKA
ncbi:DNA polymerase [Gordonia humi]|uniref:SF3 helicase domain-containing protein n=1 Tax=Gordonia humi TaxID=686429 RepID=A0A840FAS4_9ACTN|nr:DNA polymerase [Gordonia humi]MBB4137250.1 hypothetical protein [Gordonia humi]